MLDLPWSPNMLYIYPCSLSSYPEKSIIPRLKCGEDRIRMGIVSSTGNAHFCECGGCRLTNKCLTVKKLMMGLRACGLEFCWFARLYLKIAVEYFLLKACVKNFKNLDDQDVPCKMSKTIYLQHTRIFGTCYVKWVAIDI